MLLRRALTHLLLAVALLLGQQAMLAHAATHLTKSPASQDNKQLPHGKSCDRCVLSVQLGSALPPSVAALHVEPCTVGTFVEAYQPTRFQTLLAHRQRGPPALVSL